MLPFGGLIEGDVYACYSNCAVRGETSVGGLVGSNAGHITTSYSAGPVDGGSRVGGLVGANLYEGSVDSMVGAAIGTIASSYSVGTVSGDEAVGGLVGFAGSDDIVDSFWDAEVSGQSSSAAGTALTTAEMQDPTVLATMAGWDFIGQPDGPQDIWAEPEGGGYPVLFWQLPPEFGLPEFAGGKGESNDPYLVATAEQVNAIGHNPRLMGAHFKLIADLDMRDHRFYPIGSYDYGYRGVFDGNGHVISNAAIEGHDRLGLFCLICDTAEVKSLHVVDVSVLSTGDFVGGLVGSNRGCAVTNCSATGVVTSVGSNVGGLVGGNFYGSITNCSSEGVVDGGSHRIGGLVGNNFYGSIANCYSTSAVAGRERQVGGLVGSNQGSIETSYSTGSVVGSEETGGLVGTNPDGDIVTSSFWDVETSGLSTSDGGNGKNTGAMQTAGTYRNVGWDFIGETENGTEEIWWIDEGQDYPRLWWELGDEASP
jgi:hypothetical protein